MWGRRAAAALVLSIAVHIAIMFVLSIFFRAAPVVDGHWSPIVWQPQEEPPQDELTAWVTIPQQVGDRTQQVQSASTLPPGHVPDKIDLPTVAFPERVYKRTARWVIGPKRQPHLPDYEWLASTGAAEGGGLESRRPEVRSRLLSARGGTAQSESAVQLGLAWLASAQLEDGSWRFNHHAGPLRGKCRNAGFVGTTTGATALALLPFLGAGQMPHSEGLYQEAIGRGLEYLMRRQQHTAHGGDLQEGTMYAHGLATLALCEAYAMTGDKQLGQAAQSALDFICAVQHEGGGWRYFPGQPGDMTVTGWQLMALKSGQMANLQVPQVTITRATRFLSQMQSEEGAFYGYMEPGRAPAPTAIGLLMRMYTGWPREDGRLSRGVEYLAELGPSRDDMYFNYYATQVLHHYEGPYWSAWNQRMRQYLIDTQETEGYERGSWYFYDRHGVQGGRHYTTAMALMILEVYYRCMPLYTESSVRDEFQGGRTTHEITSPLGDAVLPQPEVTCHAEGSEGSTLPCASFP
jgi:hypothetical protein